MVQAVGAVAAVTAAGDQSATLPLGWGFTATLSPCFLGLNAAMEFFQHIFTSIMMNKHTVFLIVSSVPLT